MNSRQKYTSKWKSLNSNWTYNKSQDKQVLTIKCYYAWEKVSLERFVNIHLARQSTKLFEMVIVYIEQFHMDWAWEFKSFLSNLPEYHVQQHYYGRLLYISPWQQH